MADGIDKQIVYADVYAHALFELARGKGKIEAYREELDKNAFGLPAEPYGVSGNPKIRLAPPPISAALFPVAETGASVEIRLKN